MGNPDPDNSTMARRYDSRTTIFSPEGRLFQVEYAMEAIGHAGTCLGILANDGILLAAERRNTNKLLDEVFHSEKIYHINENMACSVAGITSDANVLTQELRCGSKNFLKSSASDCFFISGRFSSLDSFKRKYPGFLKVSRYEQSSSCSESKQKVGCFCSKS